MRDYGVGVTPTQLSMISRYTCEATKGAQDARVRRLEEEIEQLRQSHATELQEIRLAHDAELEVIRQRQDTELEVIR